MQYLNSGKNCFYSDVYINDSNLLNLARIKCLKISSVKGGNQFFKFRVREKKGGNQNFPKILGGTRALHTMP